MSGHSKWSTIKHKKAASDFKKANVFTKLAGDIAIAAREGEDPKANFKLRLAIEKAREVNMPNKSIEKAIMRGAGELKGESQVEETLEAYGPGQIALLIKAIMENKNKTLAEIKNILKDCGGKFIGDRSIGWQFKPVGIIVVTGKNLDKENFEMSLIENGAEDYLQESANRYKIFTLPADLKRVSESLAQSSVEILREELGYLAKDPVEIDEKAKADCKKLISELEENENVVAVFSNMKN